ncbi:MAG: ribosome small subunit-dependent GTPase A [Planctomycetes bacterium]|nr:ribosome small subunit-dependent GTPase A [Planctomycetota bacterium]
MAKKRKIRADFRKNRSGRSRATDLTRKFAAEGLDQDSLRGERISGKGELSRRRTIVTTDAEDQSGSGVQLDVDQSACLRGRVLSVHGLLSTVETEEGALYKCATRRLLKTLSTDQRHVVAAGDRVLFRPSGADEGIIERIEPRTGALSRQSRGRQHVLVANVDQLLIIASAAEPYLKPNLIDRFLVAAERERIEPLICINKIDLVEPATLQPLVGVYSQMGYRVLLLSARTGFGIERLRRAMAGRQSVVAGQSGVGKSSLLNAIETGLHLRVASVSEESQKGRHTTTTAQLHRLASGGYVVDTPGVRQFQLWDLVPEEVAAHYRDIRPFVSHCRYPDCTHTHEEDCAVKDGVADDLIDARRYESYRHLCEGVFE